MSKNKKIKANVGAALKNAALVGSGAVGANAAEKLLRKTLLKKATISPAYMGAGKIVAGAIIPEIAGKAYKEEIEAVCNGVIAAGAIQLQQAVFPSLAGVSGVDDILSGIGADEEYYVEGIDDEDGIEGVAADFAMTGVDDDGEY